MKKKILLRGLMGLPIGIAIGHLITIFVSLSVGDGLYRPCAPQLAERFGELDAIAFQAGLCAVLGFVFGAASLIWQVERWSILKQTGLYFLTISATMLPIAYVTYWMEHTVGGFLLYAGIFFAVFVVMWLAQYLIFKRKVRKIGEKFGQQR